MSEILKKCTNCGLEAFTKNDLTLFVKGNNRNKYGRINLCTQCSRELSKARYYYKEFSNVRNFFNMATKPIKTCKFCGKEAWVLKDLEFFAPASGKRGSNNRYNVCKECYYEHYVKTGKKHFNRFGFKNKTKILDENPRTNICSKCGKSYPKELSTQTHLHHSEYDEQNPLNHTIELCNSCHQLLHWRLKKHKYNKT